MDSLRPSDPIPASGTWFQIDTVHTCTDAPPWFTGYRQHHPGQVTPDTRTALRLHLTAEPEGRISVLLTADDRNVYGLRHQLAAWTALPANTWTAAVAPTVAAHPWAAHTHHWTKRKTGGNKILRAALAYILTSR
jgi:hypothetical protein